MINGIDSVALTKLDVLSKFEEIKICTGYEYNGKLLKSFPTDFERLDTSKPIYKTVPGWNVDISTCSSYAELPEATKDYLKIISEESEIEINIISVGPKRAQTFFVS